MFRVCGSCNGLLCLVHYSFKFLIYVCNPFTGEYIELPDPISTSQRLWEMVICFGFSPKTNEYKLVGINHNSVEMPVGCSEVLVLTLGDESWREKGHLPYVIRRSSSVAYVNGGLHWVGVSPVDVIVCFNLEDEVFGVIPLPEFQNEQGCYSLGVLNGCLSIMDSAFNGYSDVEIWVLEEYGDKESWTKCYAINFDELGLVGWNIRINGTLCFQSCGKLLLLYNNQDLLLYDTRTESLIKLRIGQLPSLFEGSTHVVSLISPSNCLRRDRQL